MPRPNNNLSAFTLIEISIVVLVIALLMGGVVVTLNMKANAKIQNTLAEKERYVAAIYEFRDKYDGLPGDLYNATSYWPEDTTGSNWQGSTNNEVENGNGDGKISQTPTSDSGGYEASTAWRHMALAGIIDGEYDGYYDANGSVTAGTRTPRASYHVISGANGWQVYYIGSKVSDAAFFDGQYHHIFMFSDYAYGASIATKVSMFVEDMRAMDVKFDDGKPATGNIRSGKNGGTMGGACVSTDVASTAIYDASLNTTYCLPIFLTGIN